MNSPANHVEKSSLRLLPHQAAFVDAFFEPASKRVILLRADVGLGKSQAMVALVERVLQLQPSAKVLLLAPKSLRQSFLKGLRNEQIPALSVDRYQFREMLDSAKGQDIWPAGTVSILSRGFAQQPDIAQALVTTRWDLLIVDEAHQSRAGSSREVLRGIAQASRRVILSTATLNSSDLPGLFAEDETTVIQWRSDQIVDSSGAIIASRPRPIVNLVSFNLSEAELIWEEAVTSLSRLFEAGDAREQFIANSLLRSLQSSPAALESALTRINSPRALDLIAPSPDEQHSQNDAGGALDLDLAAQARALASQILEVMDVDRSDSKLEELAILLAAIVEPVDLDPRVCILTEYMSTLMYLDTAFETHEASCELLHAGMNPEEQDEALKRFISNGMFLAATLAAITEDAALAQVTDLIFYDLPGSPTALKEVLAKFDGIYRKTQLTVHALVASDGLGSTAASASLEFLRSRELW